MTRHTARKVPGRDGGRQSAGSRRHRSRLRPGTCPLAPLLAVLVAGAAACGGDTRGWEDADTAREGPIALGVDVLFQDSLHLLRGRSVGLITNHTGVSWPRPEGASDTVAGAAVYRPAPSRDSAVSTIDRLHRHPDVDLVALYSPEHGIRGVARAGQAVEGGVDEATGLPIHSLYGDTRTPTPAMLDGVEVLVFDIQDIGARYYTYVWTMALAMEAAGEHGIDFVVLDRPNPLGGERVQGNVLDPEFATFVGLYPVPMRHGLTVGELARFLVGEQGIDVNLTVVPMRGWARRLWHPQTGLPFVPPSPNMPSVASATHYPGTCLFEGTNLSVGRGTDAPFQWIGAPWLDADSVAARMNRLVRDQAEEPADPGDSGLAGFYVDATRFTPEDPGDGKFGGRELRALRFQMTDPRTYDPTRAAVAALVLIRELHADRLEWREAHFDRLAGTHALREGISAGESLEVLVAGWEQQQREFRRLREPYLLY